jgi:MFS family permease
VPDYHQILAQAHARDAARRAPLGAGPAWHDPGGVSESTGPSTPARLAGIQLAPGFLPGHLVAYLYAAFVTVGLLAFVSFMQAWLLNVNLGMAPQLQGRTVSALNFANELLALCLVAPFGALADKIGRRTVYACGLSWLAAGFLLYPLARTLPQLLGCALFFSVGVAAVGTMLGTVLADTPREASRGRLVGVAGFFQGLGALTLIATLGKTPQWLSHAGFDELAAGRITMGIAATISAASALLVFIGLRQGSPSTRAPAMPLVRILREGVGAARRNPRIWMACLLQFGSFGDRVVLGTFLMLRLQQAWLERGYSMAEAASRARVPFVVAMAAGLVTALVVGALLDRVDRLRIGIAAMALAGVAYLACGFISDPTQDLLLISVVILLGAGQIAAIIAGQTLLGQEAPLDVRGAVFGLAGICASAAILFTNAFGGWLYDTVSRGGPFFLLAGVNLTIALVGLRLSRRS